MRVWLGEKHRNRYQRRSMDEAPMINSQNHIYDSSDHIPVTKRDLERIDKDVSDINNPGARWVHEKTMYAQPNPQQVTDLGLTQRVLQLFAHVAEDGTMLRGRQLEGGIKYRLDQHTNDQRMVVKIIGDKSRSGLQEHIEREAIPHWTSSKLRSPHIVECYCYAYRWREHAPYLGYIYMEYAPFGDLTSLLQKIKEDPT